MEAIERVFFSSDWVTLLFLIALFLVFLMKLYYPNQLIGYASAFFTKGFFKKQVEENVPVITSFHILLFVFSCLIFSLFFAFGFLKEYNLNNISIVFVLVGLYLLIRYIIDIIILQTLQLDAILCYLQFLKVGYFYTVALWLFPISIVYYYGFKNYKIVLFLMVLLLFLRFYLIVNNNKKLIFSHLFYFILYFCTLEIAPLLIIYKTITT